jgi:hypothetical protein
LRGSFSSLNENCGGGLTPTSLSSISFTRVN